MRCLAVALLLAACTPDGEQFPVMPSSANVPALGGMQEGTDIDVGPDAGNGIPPVDGGLGDGGGISDARGVFDGGGPTPFDGGFDEFLDAPPGGIDQIPGNPDQIP
jgi:hypothetical protein